MKQKLSRYCPAGLVLSNTPQAGLEGPAEVIFAGVIGAMVGFVIGLLVGSFARLLTMDAVRGATGGMHWAAYGAVAGAMALAAIELLD